MKPNEVYFLLNSFQILFTNQFSVTRHQKVVGNALTGESGLPGLFFMYEISPMMVKYTEVQRFVISISHTL